MPNYRPPRVGDTLAVRTSDPRFDEAHVLITSVADNGGYLILSGAWRGTDLEVVIRRVGDHHTLEL